MPAHTDLLPKALPAHQAPDHDILALLVLAGGGVRGRVAKVSWHQIRRASRCEFRLTQPTRDGRFFGTPAVPVADICLQ
jgi:hypothetical protein